MVGTFLERNGTVPVSGGVMTSEALFQAIKDGSVEKKYGGIPFGILYCGGGKHPEVLYTNRKMQTFLCADRDPERWDLLKDDLYLSIPYLERDAFRKSMEEAASCQVLVEVTHSFFRTNGSVVRLNGWIIAQRGEHDTIFKLMYQPQEKAETNESPGYQEAVINALKNAYDVVLHFDLSGRYCEFVKCSRLNNDYMYMGLKVLLNNSLDNFIGTAICEADRENLRHLIEKLFSEKELTSEDDIEYGFIKSGNVDRYYCTALKLGPKDAYICCRLLSDGKPRAEKAPEEETKSGIRVRTFGYFDVFVNGRAIPFKNKKAKELLALLIARNGGFVSPDEIIGCLWENETVNKSTLARIRKTYFGLVNELREYGIGDLVESQGSARRVVPELIENCDLYLYLGGDRYAGRPEVFLRNYSWGEYIAGDLFGEEENLSC